MPGVNPNALIIPARGLVYKGDVDATPPLSASALTTLSDTVVPSGGGNWVCLGHSSRENLPAYSKDGGDTNSFDSWWQTGIDSTTDPMSYSLTLNQLQSDAVTLGLAFGGGTINNTAGFYDIGDITNVACSLLILMVGGTKRRAFYHPNASVSIGDLPELATDSYLEIQLQAALNTSAGTTGPSTTSGTGWSGKRWRMIDAALISA